MSSLRLFAAFLLCSCAGRLIRPTTDERVLATPERLERGKYLVNTIAGCTTCHASRENADVTKPEDEDNPLSGGLYFRDLLGTWVPNLTSDVETGLGGWTDDQIMRAIRDGISKDGHILMPVMPYARYRSLSDEDVRAVVVYLRSVPPAKPVTPRQPNEIPFFVNVLVGLGVTLHEPAKDVAAPRDEPLARGEYVARIGHCTDCHSLTSQGARADDDRYLAGSDLPLVTPGIGKIWASNLTPDLETGVGKYTAAQLKATLKSGRRLDGKLMGPPMSDFIAHLTLATDADLDALVFYLRQQKPVKNAVPVRQLEPAAAALLDGQ